MPLPPNWTKISGAISGTESRWVANQLQPKSCFLWVLRDHKSLEVRQKALEFFAPTVKTLIYPAWDIQPYDRLSPSRRITEERLTTLAYMTLSSKNNETAPLIILTTAQALCEKIGPAKALSDGMISLKAGMSFSFSDLEKRLCELGYSRASIVTETGDYAVRGGIIDLFAQGQENPIRLDFFGDKLESLRTFDRESQRSLSSITELVILPSREIPFHEKAKTLFRTSFNAQFGASPSDIFYESVSQGQFRQGLEQYLPLFYEKTDCLLDYTPSCDAVIFDDQALKSFETFYLSAIDAFESLNQVEKNQGGLKLLPPDLRFMSYDLLINRLNDFKVFCLDANPETEEVSPSSSQKINAQRGRDFSEARKLDSTNLFHTVAAHAQSLSASGKRVLFASQSEGASERLSLMLADHGLSAPRFAKTYPDALDFGPKGVRAKPIQRCVLPLESGFEWDDLIIISETDILGERLGRVTKRKSAQKFIAEASSLSKGDLIVHIEHGIGRFEGLKTLDINQAPHDCLELSYADDTKLYLPVENIDLLSRYGSDSDAASLDRLGSASWQSRKAKAKARLRDMAEGLIALAASRAVKCGPEVNFGSYFDEFCAQFPFEETEDQLSAIGDVLDDFGKTCPMDRLICGDVGFGKTEVAIRAAFVAAMAGYQVALICPTTLLAQQHYRTFAKRMTGWPLKVRGLSRLIPRAEAKETQEGLKSGEVDIVIGTHALLSQTIGFKRLGLAIIDEEQHFGVKHKERLKSYRADVHVLSMSATPIPRTLQMALSGLRDLSIISTPPIDRMAIRTYVLTRDMVQIRDALLREKYRGGQAYYVAPRLSDLEKIAELIRNHVPEIKFIIGHGQMSPTQLEDVMTAFYDGQYDLLISTTIIESGLDVPTANTLIVHRADMFGLSQLYQIRGRVGRAKVRAYAYLTTEPNIPIGEAAEKRLKLLQSLESLGAGFQLASHDLDTRGGGNLLGEEQSGHIREVGVELYQQMLEEAVASVKDRDSESDNQENEHWSPQINVGAAILIPETYIADLTVRLSIYRRISQSEAVQDRESLASELIDRFGPIPDEAEHLLRVIGLKGMARQCHVKKLDVGPKGAIVSFKNNSFPNPKGIVNLIASRPQEWKIRQDQSIFVKGEWPNEEGRLKFAETILKKLIDCLKTV